MNVNLGITGTSLSVLGNITASGNTHIMNATAGGGDVSLRIRNYASGTSSLYLNNNNTLSSRINSDALGNIIITSYTNTSTIKFYSGSTIDYTISSTGGANGSDVRWKTDVANITNALDKINNLQGKTFILNNNPNRQMGFIAQDVISVVPEAVYIDTSDENNYHFLYYDRLVALMNEGIKEQQQMINNNISTITSLITRVSILEGGQAP